MPSIIEGYNYDIFISYRQKDNKGDKWVSEFVESLRNELESTFKEEISVYFDINPHDGLLDTHDVDASLKEKLKCLIFIPIISRTYCDPKSFAWEHEFMVFLDQASKDKFGLKVRLPNGNVAGRVLPIRIYDLDPADIKLCESVLGGVLRGVEFIYSESGVNRPLKPEDDEKANLNKTKYRNQINKVGNAVKEIILGIKAEPDKAVEEKVHIKEPSEEAGKEEKQEEKSDKKKTDRAGVMILAAGVILLVIVGIIFFPGIIRQNTKKGMGSTADKISILVFPFQNLTPDTLLNFWQEGVQNLLITSLSNSEELSVLPFQTVTEMLGYKGYTNNKTITSEIGLNLAQKLEASFLITGSIVKAGDRIRINAQIRKTDTEQINKSFVEEGSTENDLFTIADTLSRQIKDLLEIKGLEKQLIIDASSFSATTSPVAYRYYVEGMKLAMDANTRSLSFSPLRKAIELDSTFTGAYFWLSFLSWNISNNDQASVYISKGLSSKPEISLYDKLSLEFVKALNAKDLQKVLTIEEQIIALKPDIPMWRCWAGNEYRNFGQYEKSVESYKKAHDFYKKMGMMIPAQELNRIFIESLHKTGRHKEESEICKEALAKWPDNKIFIRSQAVCAFSRGKTNKGDEFIAKLVLIWKKQKNYTEDGLLLNQAAIFGDAGKTEKARDLFEASLKINPEDINTQYYYSSFIIKNNIDINKGLDIINELLKKAPNNPNYPDYLYFKGMGEYKKGDLSEANESLKKAEALSRRYSHERYLLIKEAEKALALQNKK